MGFSQHKAWEISIAVSELVSNVIKHAGTGMLRLFELSGTGDGIEIEVEDSGPGIPDIQSSLIDGYSEGRLISEDELRRARGLGTGLGAIMRLMDEVKIENRKSGGTRVSAKKWIRYTNKS